MNPSPIPRSTEDLIDKPAEQQVNRACEACRLLKVRCLPDSASITAKCQRCNKSGRICIYALPQKRRQRIRTDTRVAELEREIRAMRSLLTGGEEPIVQGRRVEKKAVAVHAARDTIPLVEADSSTTLSGTEARSSADGNNLSRQSSIPTSLANTPDDGGGASNLNWHSAPEETQDYGILSEEISNQLFQSYNTHLVQHYPAVPFPKNMTPDIVRKSKPILFQAVVTAAACQLDPVLFSGLFKEMTKVYAERIFINGEKSVELIQSLILTSVWYCPPGESCGPSNLHFYQYIHMAATMALDLGIGIAVDKSVVTLDECRILLACYLNCAGVAMRMHRPNMLQWTGGMNDCLEVLESSPETTVLDRRLAAWVRLQNIADEWSKSVGSINPRVELSLKGFERQLQRWKEDAGPGVLNSSLMLAYYQDSIYLHESALESGSTTLFDFNHRVFRPISESRTVEAHDEVQRPLTAAYVNAVMSCINSSHALLEDFLGTETQTLRVVPIVHFVRASYATVVLVKLFISASAPSSELGEILDPQLLKVDYYIQSVLDKVSEAAGPRKLRIPSKWLRITLQVSDWYQKQVMALSPGHDLTQQASHNDHQAGAHPADEPSRGQSTQSSWKTDHFSIISSIHQNVPPPPPSSTTDSAPQPSSQHIHTQGPPTIDPPTDPSALPLDFALNDGQYDGDHHHHIHNHQNEQQLNPLDHLASFAPMDFSLPMDDFSFLDFPHDLSSAALAGTWMAEGNDGSGPADMSYETDGVGNWGFEF